MSPLLIIRKLYKQIPAFECKPGCHECCGIVPWARSEWEQISDKRNYKSVICPYIGPEGCEVYEKRPLMCRLFGAVDDPILKCPYGCAPSNKMLTKKQAQAMIRRYHELMDL